MGYPYDKTYLEEIQSNKEECRRISEAYSTLTAKYMNDNKLHGLEELSITEQFALLGEAFELSSWNLDGIADGYHFMSDVVDALLTPREGDTDEKVGN